MAERIVRQLIDDIDGSDITDGNGDRVEFSLRGVDYQIDLSAANIAKLDKALKPYVAAATRIRGGRGRRPKNVGNESASASKSSWPRFVSGLGSTAMKCQTAAGLRPR